MILYAEVLVGGGLLRVGLGNELTAGLGLPPAPAQGALSMASGSDMTWVELPGCRRVCTALYPGADQSLCPQSWVCLRTFCKCFSLTSREVSMALPGVPEPAHTDLLDAPPWGFTWSVTGHGPGVAWGLEHR